MEIDFEAVFKGLRNNWKELIAGRITQEERDGYKKGVFDTLFNLGLSEQYYDWCEENDICTNHDL